ncbi:YoaK family protein [Micromonospora sp. NPDC048999]|uniref:YoaK family protein n=1 Tax=Micromonospora sp. NPDC048999 TaxID=3155391 RepID=UPI0033D65978
MQRRRSQLVGAAALAACAGAVDLLAVTILGGAFASIVTGNLVTLGYGLSGADPHRALAAVTATAGFGVGVGVWTWLGRARPAAVLGPLAAELVALIVLAAGLLATGSRPDPVAAGALLAVAALAMGGQSAVALRLKVPTTYLTGTLTTAIGALVTGQRSGQGQRFIQLLALVAGAATAAVLRAHLPSAAPLLPPLLLAAAIVLLAHGRRVERTGSAPSHPEQAEPARPRTEPAKV